MLLFRTWLTSPLLLALFTASVWADQSPSETSRDSAGTNAPQAISQETEDTAQSTDRPLAYFPFVFSTPETGFGGGAALIYTELVPKSDPIQRPNSIQLMGLYTAKEQSSFYCTTDLYPLKRRLQISSKAGYSNMPSLFYGIGNNTSIDSEEDLTIESAIAEISAQYLVYNSFRAGLAFIWRNVTILEPEAGGIIAERSVIGSRGGTSVGLGPEIEWDTRDKVFYPRRGLWCRLRATYFDSNLGSDFIYDRYRLDCRAYIPLASSHILANQFYISSRTGSVPFYSLAKLGDFQRGILDTRHVDKSALVLQSEYRFPIYRRLLGAAFASFGQVSPLVDEFRIDEFKFNAGGGLRFILNRQEMINIRLDFGAGADGVEVYFQMLEAF